MPAAFVSSYIPLSWQPNILGSQSILGSITTTVSSFKASSLRFWTFLTSPGLGGTLEQDVMTPQNLVSFIPTKPVPCGQHWCSRTVHSRWVLASLDHIYRPLCAWVVVFEQGTPSDIYFVQALFFQIHLPFKELEPLVGRVVSLQNLFSCSGAE